MLAAGRWRAQSGAECSATPGARRPPSERSRNGARPRRSRVRRRPGGVIPRSPATGRACALGFAIAFVCAVAPPARGGEPAAADATSSPTGAAPADASEEIVVVGQRRPGQTGRDPTAAATVVEAERFAGEAKGVAELVGTAPGVAVSGYGGLGQLATVSIRGSTSSGVLVLLDGLPLNTAAGGGVDLSTIPRAWISRIEIVRGAEGAHYGVGALGGVVNVVTRAAGAEGWSGELAGGSFETFSSSADAGARSGR